MASGSSGRSNSGSKGFDFASDNILCSYEDYGNNRDSNSNGNLTDPSKDFQKSRMARTSMFPAPAFNPPEDSLNQDVIATVDKSMKKYTDNLMRFLEGISSRLSQLELYCYNLDKSIGEMRSDLNRDHGEQDSKLKSLEKHIQEVHRSVQILRDKQELAETEKELAKLQLAQKDSSSSSHSQSNEERSLPSTTDPKKTDNASDANNQQLALALPHQITPQQQPAAPPPQAPAPNMTQATQQPSYYMPPTHLPNPQAMSQLPQNQYLPSDQQYRVAPQPTPPSQVTPSPPVQQFSQYQQQQQQQQWPQQVPQQVQPPQPPSMQQPQIRPPSSAVYPSYQPNQATNQSPTETLSHSMPMQMPYSGVPQGTNRADAMQYGYGGGSGGRTIPPQQPQPHQIKGSFPSQQGDGYGPPSSAYMMYDGEGGRSHHAPQQQPGYPPTSAQAGYPPTSASLQNPNHMVRNPNQSQHVRNHPYNELIEKLVSMGFRGDHVASVIQRMEESGQPIDFNSVLDRLNVHGSVGPQRGGWSG